jgi:hypothetical protein
MGARGLDLIYMENARGHVGENACRRGTLSIETQEPSSRWGKVAAEPGGSRGHHSHKSRLVRLG